MEANELRLGNLVTIDNEKHWAKLKNEPLKVTAINQLQDLEGSKNGVSLEHLVQLPNNYYETYSQYLHFIKPIELNEAWLIKSGLKDGIGYHNSNFSGCIKIEYNTFVESYEIYVGEINLRFLDYVHEAQNIVFALTGEELKLKDKQDEK